MKSRREYDDETARHQRRLALLRMQGETNRLATRVVYTTVIAAVLLALALVLAVSA